MVDGERILGAGFRPFDGAAETDRGEREGRGLRLRNALAPEGPADVGDDDAELLGWAAEHLRKAGELAVLVLGGEPEREQVAFRVMRGKDGARLERSRDEPRDPHRLAHGRVRVGERRVDVAGTEA